MRRLALAAALLWACGEESGLEQLVEFVSCDEYVCIGADRVDDDRCIWDSVQVDGRDARVEIAPVTGADGCVDVMTTVVWGER